MPFVSQRVRFACGVFCAGSMLACLAMPLEAVHPLSAPALYAAYYEQAPVTLSLLPARGSQRAFAFGPWRLGARLAGGQASDHRANLYLVIPGVQHQVDGDEAWDHNTVLSAPPPEDRVAEWDVFWVAVLDPALGRDLRSERDLLLAGASSFLPGDLFEFDDLPAATFLRSYLNMTSFSDLAPYRRAGGRLPRLIILPAGYAIRTSKSD